MNKSNSKKMNDNITALYPRISREDGNDESLSIENQKKLLTGIAKKLNLTNIKCYIDDGITGTKLDREQFMMMCDDIEKGLVKTVMVKDLSRLSRDKTQANDLVEKFFPLHNVRFISVSDGIDSNEGEDEFLGFRTLVNEWYSRDISKKRRLTNIVKGNAGEPISNPPYGYMRDPANPKQWVIDDEAAEVVRRIYTMYLSGHGIEQIAAELAKEHTLTPVCYLKSQGKNCAGKRNAETPPTRWNHSTVAKILSVQEYCGDVINFKTFSKSFKLKERIKNTEENRAKCPGMHKQDNRMKVFRDVHEPIIERATWEKVQSKRGNTRKRTTRTSSEGVKNIFSGFLICPDCGGNLNFHFNQGNHDIQYFNCANNNKARKTCTATHYIRADFLEQIMLREIRRLTAFASLHEKEFVKMVSGFSEQAEISDVKRKEKELNRLTVRNKEIDILYERLYEDNASGKVTGRSDWT